MSKENNKNIFKHEHSWTTFCILILVLTSIILKLDCTYHTFDHATSKVQNYYSNKSTELLLNDDSFWCFNNLLEIAATPHERPGNALTTNIPEHSKDELQRLFTTSIAPDRQK